MHDAGIVKENFDILKDPELIRWVAAGDIEAFEVLCKRYEPRIRRYLASQGLQRADIEEVLDDVMVVVWQTASRFNGTSKLSTWILGIAHFKALKAWRMTGPTQIGDDPPEGVENHDPESIVSEAEIAERVRQAVNKLPSELRAVMELTYFHEQSQAEIAEILKCPVNTVKTRMFRARQRLSSQLSNYELRGLDDVEQ